MSFANALSSSAWSELSEKARIESALASQLWIGDALPILSGGVLLFKIR